MICDKIKNIINEETIIYENFNEKIEIFYDEYKSHTFFDKKIKYDILTYFRKNTDNLLIMGQDAIKRNPQTILPVFNRWKWCKDLEDFSIIILNDPTLYLNNDIRCGWFQGTEDNFYMEKIKILLENISKDLKINLKNVYHYGASAGGFTSLCLASMMKGSSAIVDICQTDLFEIYYKISSLSLDKTFENKIKKITHDILKTSYHDKNIEEILNIYKNRISVNHCFRKYNNIPNILYLQNINDVLHNMCIGSFINLFSESHSLLPENKNKIFEMHFYNNKGEVGKGGHDVLDKKNTIEKIKYAVKIFNKNN